MIAKYNFRQVISLFTSSDFEVLCGEVQKASFVAYTKGIMVPICVMIVPVISYNTSGAVRDGYCYDLWQYAMHMHAWSSPEFSIRTYKFNREESGLKNMMLKFSIAMI